MISFRSVDFAFGRRPVLSAFSLECHPGTTTALLGPSGCGKSTLVRLACGLLAPQAGTVLAGERNVKLGDVKGVLFQEDTLLPWLGASKNAWFPRRYDGLQRPEKLRVLFDEFGLSGAEALLPHELSMGMRKRVELVRALCADDRYLVGDEPFSALDVHQRHRLWSFWRKEIEETGRVALLVSHDLDEALTVADRILLLSPDAPTRIQLSVARENGRFPGEFREKVLALILGQRAV
ncbi:MAG: ABC transporter ATP-binding protein [Gemmatimonadaceae bacterium]|nr:ABC transporter ATP-binding protein [Gemmatimonadaceae bacterium]